MAQEGKSFACSICGKEITVNKEGENPAPPSCCGKVMDEME